MRRVAQPDWYRSLPHSPMVYPDSFGNKLKYAFWRAYTPAHPHVRDFLMSTGVVWHEGRQNFLFGTIAPEQTLEALVAHLVSRGWGNHFVAWHDEGELVSLRKVDGFECQYHLRIFEDGEVRGHYEYTPECYPISHLLEVDIEDRREHFLELLGGFIVPHESSVER